MGSSWGKKMQRDKSLFEHRDIPSLLALNHWESLGHITTDGKIVSFHPSNGTNAASFECHAALCVKRVAFRPDKVISQVRICVFQ